MAKLAEQGLRLRDVVRHFGDVPAVDGVSLTVSAGEVVCLLGPSGCGKTTTLRIAAGLERQESGQVYIDGREVAGPRVFVPPERRGVGLMFQDFALFPHLDVMGNVTFGLTGLRADEARRRARQVLTLVGLEHMSSAWPHTLSGGEQQRVALARALAPQPGVVLMDEPFSGLDKRLRDQVRSETIRILKQAGTAALFVTHEPEEAMLVADRIALMRRGRIVQFGTARDLYMHPRDRDVAFFFSDLNEFEGRVSDGTVATPLGRLPSNGVGEGQMARVCIRPEAVELAGEGDGAVEARVAESRFLGHETLAELLVGESTARVRALIPGRVPLEVGERTRIRLKEHGAFVFAWDSRTD